MNESLYAVLKTVLIILLVYFGFKIFIRFFGPLILKYFMKKVGKKVEQQFNQQFGGFAQNKQEKEKTTLDKNPKSNTRNDKKVGEYIDYEEID